MHFNQLFKRLWTHHIKLTVRFVIFSYTFRIQIRGCRWSIHAQRTQSIVRCLFVLIAVTSLESATHQLHQIFHFHHVVWCFFFPLIAFDHCVIVGSLLLNFMVFVARWLRAHTDTERQSLMFICFELLILCLCFDVKIAFPIDPISNVHLHTHCTELATHTHTHNI